MNKALTPPPPLHFESFAPGVWLQQYKYKSFSPVTVNRAWLWQDPRINTLLEQATRALGELNAVLRVLSELLQRRLVLGNYHL